VENPQATTSGAKMRGMHSVNTIRIGKDHE
jgi:hypothetical protein